LVFLGRIDRQVKIRGHRVEPGEIEARLNAHPAVAQAAVVVLRNGDGPELVAHVVISGTPPTETQLRAHLGSFLPEPLLPRRIHVRPSLPLMPSGKVDYAALESAPASAGAHTGARPLRGPLRRPLEEAIAAIWCEVLQREDVDIDAHFADLGGDSLALVRVLGRLQRRFGAGATLVDLFRHPTIRSTARLLEDAARGSSADAGRERPNVPSRPAAR
jgi:acyl carrier protein